VSKFFDPVARGFHLKEYTVAELDQLFRAVGFSEVQAYPRFRGRYVRMPMSFIKGFEWLFGLLPAAVRRRTGRWPVIQNLLSVPLRAIR